MEQTIQIAVNPLIALATDLLSHVNQLREQKTPPDFKQLHQNLAELVKIFENKTHARGYRSQVILAARYMLCALLDETVLTQPWGKKSPWVEHNLLNTFQRDAWDDERFFLLLERSAENPHVYIDVLELGYVCLSLGYQGQYRDTQNTDERTIILDNLYDLIRRIRGDFSSHSLGCNTPTEASPKFQLRLPPLWVTVLATGLLLTAIFIPYRAKLNKLEQPSQTTGMTYAQPHR